MSRRLYGYLFFIVFTVLLLIGAYAHGAVGNKKYSNSLGVPMYSENPLIYNAGGVAEVSMLDHNLSIRFKPIGTYALYDEDILFCGLPVEKFKGLDVQSVVLVYERQVHRTFKGVGCHELKDVFMIKPKELR